MTIEMRGTRRRFVGTGAALLLGVGVSHRVALGQGTPEATPVSALPVELPACGVQPDGSWAFTDDLGVTVTADAAPSKVIAHVGMAAALFDFGFEVIGYYNPATDADGNPLQIAGNLPLDRLTHIGDYEDIDLELMLSLGADLFIGQNYEVATGEMWPFSPDLLEQIESIVPVLSFAYGDGATVLRNIQTIENLAASLGADVDDPEVSGSREAFGAATEELRAALAAKPDLTALFLSGGETGFWVDNASPAGTSYYRTLGMEVYPDPGMGEVSWEQFLDFEADLIFVDDRQPVWWSPEQLAAEIPVWDHHPAVIAGQVGPWRAQFISSYAGYTPVLTELVEWVQGADDSIGSGSFGPLAGVQGGSGRARDLSTSVEMTPCLSFRAGSRNLLLPETLSPDPTSRRGKRKEISPLRFAAVEMTGGGIAAVEMTGEGALQNDGS